MARLKTFLIYALCIVGFWLLSDLLINVGLNSMYKPMENTNSDDSNGQIEVYQAESTLVNGRILGTVHNPDHKKYVKMQLFSERNNEIGTQYYELNNDQMSEDGTTPLDIHFKTRGAKSYKLDLVDEKEDISGETIKLLPKDISGAELFFGVLIILMLW